ncbi:MAG: 1,4-dihydroxy-2-naphthoate octaprenyltransferase [Bacteroidaceae bacterium]|nr:1,4-dihydroxy-2-naphthoate octaprenyltransferase [Bacteroidaceae bacterium]
MAEVGTNSIKAWILAARPKTLSGAAVPVIVALTKAWADTDSIVWIPAVLCLLFALVMQIDANFVNDYFDCIKGVDGKDRLGPERACAQGWVTLPAMRWMIAATTLLAAATGLPLIHWGGMEMIYIGIACIIFCFLYTTLLSRIGMGDLLVLVFFGIVPVCATYNLQTRCVTTDIVLLSLSCGLVTDCLLVVNNYRDRDTDRKAGKRTLVTLIGEKATEKLYLGLAVVALLLTLPVLQWAAFLIIVWLFVAHIPTWRYMKMVNHGRELNEILAMTAKNIAVFGIFLACSIFLLRAYNAIVSLTEQLNNL